MGGGDDKEEGESSTLSSGRRAGSSTRRNKNAAKVLERKVEEAANMDIEEEDPQSKGVDGEINLANEQEMGREDTVTKRGDVNLGINNEGNTRKNARKARNQIRRENWGDKRELDVTKAKYVLPETAAATGVKVCPVLSPPVGVRKRSTKLSP